MRTNKWMSVVLIFSLSLNFGFMGFWQLTLLDALLQDSPDEGETDVAVEAPALAEFLLRPDQRRKFMAHRAARKSEFLRFSQKADAAQEQFLQILAQPDPDPTAVQEALDAAVAEQARFRRTVFMALKQFRDTLDVGQRRQLHELLRGHGGRGPDGRTHRPRGRRRRPPMQTHRPPRGPEGAAPRTPGSL